MINSKNNVAYIDGANLHKAVDSLDWDLDYARFRTWLREKYGVKKAYIFIGLIPKFKNLYTYLQEVGFTLVFKEVLYSGGKIKGNCDAELIVRCMMDVYENVYDGAVLVSSDGDYSVLVSFLIEKGKLEALISPAISKKCSVLLKRTGAKISYIGDQSSILSAQKEKAPDKDETL